MDIVQAIRERKSIRGYKMTPIPKDTIKEILNLAKHATSRENSQPWQVTVLTGDILDNVRKGNIELLTAGVFPNPDIVMNNLEGEYRKRKIEIAVQLFELMGIKREDKEKRDEWMQRGLRYFDAPVALILSTDNSVDIAHGQFDLSGFAQTICLVAVDYGVGTCIEIQGTMYPDVIRTYTGIPKSMRISVAIAMGYPDWDFPANKVVSKRESVDNFTTWCGFD